jgi:hypothetical protein
MKIEIRPLNRAVAQLREDLANYPGVLETIRGIRHERLRERVLSVLYYMADEKVGLVDQLPNRLTALDYAFGEEGWLYGTMFRQAAAPLILRADYHAMMILINWEQDPGASIQALDALMDEVFSVTRLRVVVGLKKGFFGGERPDIRNVALPVVSGISAAL